MYMVNAYEDAKQPANKGSIEVYAWNRLKKHNSNKQVLQKKYAHTLPKQQLDYIQELLFEKQFTLYARRHSSVDQLEIAVINSKSTGLSSPAADGLAVPTDVIQFHLTGDL